MWSMMEEVDGEGGEDEACVTCLTCKYLGMWISSSFNLFLFLQMEDSDTSSLLDTELLSAG